MEPSQHSGETPVDFATRAEAFLFSEGGSLTLKKLAQLLGTDTAGLTNALDELSKRLQGRGLTLIVTELEATLAIEKSASLVVQAAYERELGKEIGDAGLEVLAIILYEGPSTRARIDYVRGVNTSSTVRTLLSRGLLERTGNPDDACEYLYRPTAELLAFIGTTHAQELPDYASISSELAAFKERTSPFQSDHGDTSRTADDDAGA